MKKKVILICVLPVLFLMISAAVILHIPESGEPTEFTKNLYKNIAISQLDKEIDFVGQDIVTFEDGILRTFEIRSHESAEVLYSYIRNSSCIMDLTHSCLAPEEIPLLVGDSCSGGFTHIYFTLPVTHRFISFYFTEEDSELFYEYVISVADAQKQN